MNYFELVEFKGIKYSIEKNLATVVSVADSTLCDIKIPSVIFGNIKVVGVDNKAFSRQSQITSITLPDSVEFVGKNAFAWCPSLQSIKMNGVKVIDERAFMGDAKLSIIEFSDNLIEIGDKAFAYCNSLVAIKLPESVEYIGTGIFEGCRYLKFVSIPDRINIIGNSAFYACTSLIGVKLPKELTYIDEYAFAYCVNLSDISISKSTVINREAFYECGETKAKILVS